MHIIICIVKTVAVACSLRLVEHQRVNNRFQIGVERRSVLSFAFALEVALE